ncbi:MAG TPA: HAMP domain-containing sensor histidine kinase, partial [Thermoguttaceae bacterium]|nr:HAMP domain-containing sensor histidine kinase [Thermoguttaceae bacterium]
LDVTVNDLLHFTSDRDPRLHVFPLAKLIEDVRVTLDPQLSAQSIETVTEIDDDLCVTADRDMLRRAVLNLMLNAVDAMPEGGVLTVSASSHSHGIEVKVADTGEGMSEEDARRIFEPFYTTKQGGTGLGLAIVYRIAEVHGGRITGESRPDGGALFTLTIPPPAQKAAA